MASIKISMHYVTTMSIHNLSSLSGCGIKVATTLTIESVAILAVPESLVEQDDVEYGKCREMLISA